MVVVEAEAVGAESCCCLCCCCCCCCFQIVSDGDDDGLVAAIKEEHIYSKIRKQKSNICGIFKKLDDKKTKARGIFGF